MSDFKRLLYGIVGKSVSFESASGKGISTEDIEEGGQLSVESSEGNAFRFHQVEPGVFKFQSISSGLFLGISSEEPRECPCGFLLASTLADDSDAANLVAIPATNDDEDYMSFESSTNAGFILTCWKDQLWFFSKSLVEKDNFPSESSWKFSPKLDPVDDLVSALPADVPLQIKSESDEGTFSASSDEVGSQFVYEGKDFFTIQFVQPLIYKMESNSQPGFFLGVGEQGEDGHFTCALVEDGEDAHLQVVAARSGTENLVSIEPASHPGFYLCNSDSCMCFSKDAVDNSSWCIEEYLKAEREQLDALIDKDFLFRAENDYGLSTQDDSGHKLWKLWSDDDADMGEQLFNSADDDRWRLEKLSSFVYRFESITTPGAFIGVGERDEVNDVVFGHQGILVPGKHGRARVKVIPPNSGSAGFVSFESVSKPGYMLCHCNGKIWFLKEGPTDRWPQDSSWKLTEE